MQWPKIGAIETDRMVDNDRRTEICLAAIERNLYHSSKIIHQGRRKRHVKL